MSIVCAVSRNENVQIEKLPWTSRVNLVVTVLESVHFDHTRVTNMTSIFRNLET